jgi:uncharacterized protein (TIGR02118 family)
MYKLYAHWTAPAPEDVEAFEEYYVNVHAPLAAAMPGLQKLLIVRMDPGPDDSAPPLYRVAEMWWEDQQALIAAQDSPEYAAALQDAMEMQERFDVVLTSPAGDVQESPVPPVGRG